MKINHTSGPWFINNGDGYDPQLIDENCITTEGDIGQDTEICRITRIFEYDDDTQTALPTDDQTKVNAILISKVPEMFEVIQTIAKGNKSEQIMATINKANNLYKEIITLLK